MKKNYLIGAVIVAVIIILVVTLGRSKKASAPESSQTTTNSQSSTTNNALTNHVSIGTDMVFSPAIVTVSPGTTVTWTNNDSMTHTITADDGSFDSGSISTNKTFTHKFDKAGTFKYHCNFHASMTGTVEVK